MYFPSLFKAVCSPLAACTDDGMETDMELRDWCPLENWSTSETLVISA